MSNRAIFLDRDDTLIHDSGYINDPGQVRLIEGAAEALKELRAMGYKLVVVSNQSGVARGILAEKVLGTIHNRLEKLLAERGAFLDRIYYCPYLPDGAVAKYRKESDWRKPAPGMLLAAAKDLDIDLGQSWMVGDDDRDIEAGQRAGCRTILILPPARLITMNAPAHKPDYRAVNLKEAANIIRVHERSRTAKVQVEKAADSAQAAETKEETEQGVERGYEAEQMVEASTEVMAEREAVTEKAEINDAATNEMMGARKRTDEGPASDMNEAGLEGVLKSILEQLRSMQREGLFDEEFSVLRVAAGIVQVMVLFCLLIAVWFVMSPGGKDGPVFITLGFAAVLQIMALTFYMMRERK